MDVTIIIKADVDLKHHACYFDTVKMEGDLYEIATAIVLAVDAVDQDSQMDGKLMSVVRDIF
nr:MAG TPA: hypothetical protein [Caudoviricetes sp.]